MSTLENTSARTAHFELPPQWGAMRKAKELEAQGGSPIVHFEKGDYQGEEFTPSDHIIEACHQAMLDGQVRYVPGPGLDELRDAIAAEMESRGRPTGREEVLVTMGAKHALTQVLLTMVEDGDEVIFPNPGYPPDEFWTRYIGGVIKYAPLLEPDFQFDMDTLAEVMSPRTKLLIVNTPQRPNGQLVENLDGIAELCAERGVSILSDEIFSHIVYPPESHRTIASIDAAADNTIVIDTFSKTYAMTGFRIGWCVASEELIRKLDIFQQNSVTNVPAFVQMAALAALTGPQDRPQEILAKLEAKRDRMVEAMNSFPGVTCPTPSGSFYVFPDIRETGLSDRELADFLVEEHAVAVVPGSAFGDRGSGHVRLTYAAPDEVLEEGIERMQLAFERLPVKQ